MRVRSTLVAVAVAAATVTAGLATAPAAQAACVVKANLPDRVSIDRPYKEISVPLHDSCGKRYASFDLYGPRGWNDILIYDGRYAVRDYWDVYDWDVTPGTYKTRDGDAWDTDDDDLPVAHDTTTARYGSRQSISTSRRGTYVTVKGLTTRYTPVAGRFVAWSGTKVVLQRYTGSSWHWVKTLKPRYGRVTTTVHAPWVRRWRLVTQPTWMTWTRTSLVAKR